MDPFQWTIGILVTALIAVIGFIGSRLWTHVVECQNTGEKVAAIWADVERMKSDIGTHDQGMRGEIHRTSTRVTEHELRILILERKTEDSRK